MMVVWATGWLRSIAIVIVAVNGLIVCGEDDGGCHGFGCIGLGCGCPIV